jgi:glutathione synthase/RimK-type ligase-like ATP-grasp enzyme
VILAVTEPDDPHADAVLDALARMGARTARLDLASLPREVAVTVRRGGPDRGDRLLGAGPDGGPLRAEEIAAVWWRRPRWAVPHAELAGPDAAFAVEQVHAALSGIWGSLSAAWMNDPWAEDRASHKASQLAWAEAAGLAVPETIITSAPSDARAFLDALGDRPCIHKPLKATKAAWRYTRLMRSSDRDRLDDLRFGPAILQAYVPGVDVRVTCAGGRMLATAIDARATSSPQDFRPAYAEARVTPFALPAEAARALRRYLEAARLRYAAVDFRLDGDGRLFFLEANSSGQWLFLEDRTGQPITAAVAGALLDSAREVTADPPARPSAWQGTSAGRRTA